MCLKISVSDRQRTYAGRRLKAIPVLTIVGFREAEILLVKNTMKKMFLKVE
jgi:hypothetical protein